MESLKKVVRGALVTTAMMSLISLGVAAQDQGSATNSAGQSSATSATKHSKTKKSSSAASENSSASGKLTAADKTFVKKAAEGGMAEVQLGQLAADKASNSEVKQFGQRMVDDHTKANDQLKSVAEQKGVTLPTDLSAKDKALKDKLSGLSGDQFDKMYMQHMVMDHKKDVAEFKKESNSGKDNDVKNFASQTLPTLEDHLKNAQQVASTVGASASGAKSSAKSSKSSKSSKKQTSAAMSEQVPTTPKQ